MNGIDLDAAAGALYGDSTPTRPPAPVPGVQPDAGGAAARQGHHAPPDDAAARLYGDPNEHVGEDGMDKVFGGVQREIIAAGVERLGVDEAEAQQAAQQWAQVFRDADIGTTEASTLTQIAVAALAEGVDDATLQQWALDAKTLIRTEFGATADLALSDAQAYVAKHPKLAAYLEQTGLGSHPKVVLAAARKGRALRAAGKV